MSTKPHTAVFVELPALNRYRADYMGDDAFRALQNALLADPETGDVIEGTGGLRKLRQAELTARTGQRKLP